MRIKIIPIKPVEQGVHAKEQTFKLGIYLCFFFPVEKYHEMQTKTTKCSRFDGEDYVDVLLASICVIHDPGP